MLTVNNKRPKTIWDELEAGLGSGPRLRVLLHLALHPEKAFTKYGLVKATGLRTPAVTQQLERLSDLDWIKKDESSPVMYQVCLENEVAKLIRDLFMRVSVARLYDKR
jgi:DNA-binding transcriptional ArsR family regulator